MVAASCGSSNSTSAVDAAPGDAASARFPEEGDAVILARVLDGELGAEAGMLQVARSAGWPIATSRGVLFAILDGGLGPYQVESLDGAFAPVTLKSEAGVAWALVPVAAPDGASYRLRSAFGDPFADRLSRRFRYDAAGEVAVIAASGAHLERWPLVGDEAIQPRTLRVWVPARTPTHFLYAHDGQNLFGAAGWRLDLAAGPTTLVVGIDNSAARFDEYTHVADSIEEGKTIGGRGAAYADYVELTVRPFIEAHYGSPLRVGTMGSSLGGLISYVQALRHPGRYDLVASFSGTMGWGSLTLDNPTVIELYAALGTCPAATFYLDSGGGAGSGCVDSDGDGIRDDSPNASDNYCENLQLDEVLRAIGCGPRLTYVWKDGAQHNEAAWRERAPAILARFEAL